MDFIFDNGYNLLKIPLNLPSILGDFEVIPVVQNAHGRQKNLVLTPMAGTLAQLFFAIFRVEKLFRMNRTRVGVNPALKIRLRKIVHILRHNVIVRGVVNEADHP
jgi:hypothetical protein